MKFIQTSREDNKKLNENFNSKGYATYHDNRYDQDFYSFKDNASFLNFIEDWENGEINKES